MLKAGSLLYALFVALLIGMISVAFILAAYYNSTYFAINNARKQLIRDANSGIQLLLSNAADLPPDEMREVDLYADENHIVTLQHAAWGVFEVLRSTANWKKHEERKVALSGIDTHRSEPLGLYMTDLNKPLSLCGNTVIRGATTLPKAGVKRAYIEGQHFIGKQLINGNVSRSAPQLPAVNEQLVENSLFYLEQFAKATDSVVQFDQLRLTDSIVNSFHQRTLLIHSNSALSLDNLFLKGNIIIRSDRSVRIGRNCRTSDILVYAPEIRVEEGFTGSLQLYATDTLSLAPNCSLIYPSALALVNPIRREENMTLEIGENCHIAGAVFLQNNYRYSKSQAMLKVAEKATIAGLVYCNDYLELQGNIHGSLYCRRFLLKTPSSVYENHLLNATIDPYALSPHYVGIPLMETNRPKKIVKWLY
jgi:hypothetical protein